MDRDKCIDDFMGFLQSHFETTMECMAVLQDQAERVVFALMEQEGKSLEESQAFINEWFELARRGREDYTKMMDEIFDKVVELFTPPLPLGKSK